MFLRNTLDLDLNQLEEIVSARDDGSPGQRVSPDEITFHLEATDPSITVKDVEIAATEENLSRLGDFLSIPSSFNKRLGDLIDAETQNEVYRQVLVNSVTKDLDVKIHTNGGYIAKISEWGKTGVMPGQLVRAAANAFPEGSNVQVARLVDEVHEFAFDAYVDSDDIRSAGMAGDAAVNDLTAGGLRFEVNLKQGLSPSVQPFMYRLACTNGMEASRYDLKVDARGQSVDEVLAEIEEMAKLAFAGIENQINHFYDLREVKVANPERALRAIARERKIPDRSLVTLLDLAAGEDLPDDPSMFDVVNLVTNLANSPAIRNDGGRLLLERAGGSVVADHSARCGHCAQKVQ